MSLGIATSALSSFSFLARGGVEHLLVHFNGPSEHFLGHDPARVTLLDFLDVNRVEAVFIVGVVQVEEAISCE